MKIVCCRVYMKCYLVFFFLFNFCTFFRPKIVQTKKCEFSKTQTVQYVRVCTHASYTASDRQRMTEETGIGRTERYKSTGRGRQEQQETNKDKKITAKDG